MSNERWDLFISHASEDKASLVAPLAERLAMFGVKVWYDAFALSLGDSLSRSIDKGLAESRYGLVVLSKAFFAKQWPEYELRGLTAKEIAGGKVILPVWHDVTRDDVIKFSPSLADKVAHVYDGRSVTKLAVSIIKVVRPDLGKHIHKRMAYLELRAESETVKVNAQDIKIPPVRHDKLPQQLIRRIRLIRVALLPVYPKSMQFWVEGFQRDSHPSKEVSIWEHLASVWLEFWMINSLTAEQRRSVFNFLLSMSSNKEVSQMRELIDLPDDMLDALETMWRQSYPLYEFEHENSFDAVNDSEQDSDVPEWIQEMDKEIFPRDVPDVLIRELIDEDRNAS
jgi:hypothetical protein